MHKGRKHKLKNLMNDSLESFYWLGFLLADGHFTKNGRLVVGLSTKDIDVLYNLVLFLNLDKNVIKIKGDSCRMAIMDVTTITELCQKYDIHSNKTENPPNLQAMTETQMKAFSIGFIDGDGQIFRQHNRVGCGITVKVHNSWLNILNEIFDTTPAYIQKSGYAVVNITEHEKVKDLKSFGESNKLPMMKRKWDVVNMEFTSRTVLAHERFLKIKDLYGKGFRVVDIAKELDMLYTTVYAIIQRKILTKENQYDFN